MLRKRTDRGRIRIRYKRKKPTGMKNVGFFSSNFFCPVSNWFFAQIQQFSGNFFSHLLSVPTSAPKFPILQTFKSVKEIVSQRRVKVLAQQMNHFLVLRAKNRNSSEKRQKRAKRIEKWMESKKKSRRTKKNKTKTISNRKESSHVWKDIP